MSHDYAFTLPARYLGCITIVMKAGASISLQIRKGSALFWLILLYALDCTAPSCCTKTPCALRRLLGLHHHSAEGRRQHQPAEQEGSHPTLCSCDWRSLLLCTAPHQGECYSATTTCDVPVKYQLHAADMKLLGLMHTTHVAIKAMNPIRPDLLATFLA